MDPGELILRVTIPAVSSNSRIRTSVLCIIGCWSYDHQRQMSGRGSGARGKGLAAMARYRPNLDRVKSCHEMLSINLDPGHWINRCGDSGLRRLGEKAVGDRVFSASFFQN